MIHYNKLPHSILEIFKDRQYIKRTLEEYAIKAFSSNIVLGTDKMSKVNEIYSYGHKYQKSSQCYKIDIVNCLPILSSETSFEDILYFKGNHKDELLEFKKVLRDFEEKSHNSQSV